ncbi:hypothetical protein HAX54_037234 [Datura stramonium]|uniref:Uncharacterized protein n=1 Tax=Datura stramonium TaxID=4076 RepID=A0ABS8VJS5_DATST|nr:hypothetical protein [Datura stramonium]
MSRDVPSTFDVDVVAANVETVNAAENLEEVDPLINSVIPKKFKFKKDCSCNSFGDDTVSSRICFVVQYVSRILGFVKSEEPNWGYIFERIGWSSKDNVIWLKDNGGRRRCLIERLSLDLWRSEFHLLRCFKKSRGGVPLRENHCTSEPSLDCEQMALSSWEILSLGVEASSQGVLLGKNRSVEGEIGNSVALLKDSGTLSSLSSRGFPSPDLDQGIMNPMNIKEKLSMYPHPTL